MTLTECLFAEFNGSNHIALADKYQVSMQTVYMAVKVRRDLAHLDRIPPDPKDRAQPDQAAAYANSPGALIWEDTLIRLATPSGCAALLQAVQKALWLGPQGHARLTLHRLPSTPPEDDLDRILQTPSGGKKPPQAPDHIPPAPDAETPPAPAGDHGVTGQ